MGRSPITLGIWGDMVGAAGSVENLTNVVGLSRQNLHLTFTGQRNLSGPSRVLALEFARSHGVKARLYVHPLRRGHLLISAADGWWLVGPNRSWADRVLCLRTKTDDWSTLPLLEIPFARLMALSRHSVK